MFFVFGATYIEIGAWVRLLVVPGGPYLAIRSRYMCPELCYKPHSTFDFAFLALALLEAWAKQIRRH